MNFYILDLESSTVNRSSNSPMYKRGIKILAACPATKPRYLISEEYSGIDK
ncbi:MAG: hypothetical protein ACJAYL_002854 [Cryomorphaceae bacterium]|jgi:hypothetical protein